MTYPHPYALAFMLHFQVAMLNEGRNKMLITLLAWLINTFQSNKKTSRVFLRLINASYHTIVLWDGLNHLELGLPQRAEKILSQLHVLSPTKQILERIRIELLCYQAQALAAVGNMEQAVAYLEMAVKASLAIKSSRRFQEAFSVYQKIRENWSRESKVQNLGDLFIQHSINAF
jgi:tetratricopeptide (TPR) repeat protein